MSDAPTTYGALQAMLREGPVLYDDVRPDLLGALAALILELAQRQPAGGSLNRGGWKSDEGFLDRDGAPRELAATLSRDYLGGARPVGWAMVNRSGSEHPRHQHRIAAVSAIYYVTPGDPAVPTILELPLEPTRDAVLVATAVKRRRQGLSKRTRANDPACATNEAALEPVPGLLALFTGETWHRVPRYDGDAPRITIAFDVRR